MDTNVLESYLRKMLLDDSVEIYVFNVISDSVTKYTSEDGNLVSSDVGTVTNYLENVKTMVAPEYLSGFMNVVSIPKIKEQIQGGKQKVSFNYKTLNNKSCKITSCLLNVNGQELILSVIENGVEKTSDNGINDSKYNALINRLADIILKINNVFNLDEKKTNIKNVESYVNSCLGSLTNSYPELKRSLNKNAANVSGRVDDCLLIVDDDSLTRNMIKKVFDGQYKIVMAANGKEAIDYLESNNNKGVTEASDNVLGIFLDLTMPVMDGFAVLDYLSKNNYLYRIPVIIISGDYEKETKTRVYNYGVADMLEKPFDFEVVRHRIGNFISLYKSSNSLNALISDQARDLKDLVNPFVESYLYDYKNNIENIKKYMKILGTKVMEDYPEYNLSEEKVDKMAEASMYYDLGFYSIPRTILGKKENFTNEELDKIKDYPLFGSKMLNYVLSLVSDASYKNYADNITKFYHENYNGTGYPNGLKEDEIPIEAQLASICINYNNLLKKGNNVAKDVIVRKSGVMFNPKLVKSFLKFENEFINK